MNRAATIVETSNQLPETIAVLESLAQRQGAAPAIHVPGRATLTYADLGAQIRHVRERLGTWGIRPGDIVAAAIPSRPALAVAIATFPSSCTFAPLEPSLPTDAYAVLLTRMKAKAVVVTRHDEHAIRAAAHRLGIAEIELAPEPDGPAGRFTLTLGKSGPSLARDNSCDPSHAFIMTSSGTTGRRKLVPIDHRGVLCYARSICDWLDFTPADVGVHITQVYLGNGLRSGLMNALLGGRSVVLLPVGDIDALLGAIEAYRPTFLIANFPVYKAILRRAPEFGAAAAKSRFRFLRWAGRVDLDAADRLEQLFQAPMLTGLSSTETSRVSHDPLPPRVRKRGAVGLPLVNEVALLDSAGTIRPNGGPGEIVVRGPMVFRGYLDDPELTAASFAGEWFRTGDLGRIDDDGYVYYVGRIKEIIDRGGEKISPVEIDLAIESLPGVREAAAFGVPHPTLGEEMVAAVVREQSAAVDEAQVVSHVRARAGALKAPRRVYFVDSLPRTANGKVKRKELAELLGLDRAAVVPPAPAMTDTGALSPLEGALAGLWSSLLQVPNVGRDDDFFLLGGDSLRGSQLLVHLKAVFGVDLSIRSLFAEAATVAGMARAIEALRAGERAGDWSSDTTATRSTAIRPRQDRAPARLSHAQLRLWFLARLDAEIRPYNITEVHRLVGSLDAAALRESLLAIVARHEGLRTAFPLVDDEPRQLVHATPELEFECADISSTPPELREAMLPQLIEAERHRRYDFENGPLLRFRLIRLAERDHVLVRSLHHIAWDRWSSGVFDRELNAVYAALVNGREPALPALPIQYADYAVWQREWLKHEVLEQQLAYWKNRLADLPTLSLPTDRSRPPVASYRGGRVTRDLAAPLGAAVKALALREGATLFMTLLAAFQVLLARHSGQTDIAVGSPIAGRVRPELEGLIGFFANTLVLRSDLSGNPRFRELLAQVRDNALGAYAHQDLPFEKLVEELAPVRDPSRNPLFQVLLAIQNNPGEPLALAGVQVSRLAPENHNAKFDLHLAVRETAAGMSLRWDYPIDLFDRSTIERMAGRFEVLLESIVADPGQRLSELALITAAEREQLLVAWNATASDFPRDGCIQQRFEMQAARTPEAVAVVMGDRQLSYAELNTHANRLAHQLIALGVGAEVPVAICAERSLELVVGLLGILKAGGAYVPLDPGYPRARLAFMLQDTQAPVLLTQAALLDQLPPYAGRIVCLDRDAPSLAAQPATDPPCRSTAESLAYVIYTSGSTGRPKGVAVPHRAVLRLLSGDYVRFDAQQRFLLLSPISFDASVFELWGALLHGARCAIFPERVPTSTALGDALARHQVSTLWLTASLFNLIIDEAPQTLAGVRQLLTGGEALSPAHVRAALEQLPGVQLINGYGPTEGATFTCCYAIPSRLDPARASVPIGRPIGNTRVYVLDETLSPVPIGVAGELCIAGDGLARGYLNQPELSAQKFVPDPFSTIAGARLYRTGDRVRYLPDGNLEFLGRFDDQVKIRGFRIEPGEIETVLAEHASVRQAVVLAREDTPGEKRLVAYVLAATGGLDIDALRDFVAERLPDHMRPASYVRLDHLPITPAGKVDRHVLPAPQGPCREADGAYVPPRDAIEALIGDVWCEVLNVERVGVHDNFFAIGGHSLLAAQVLSRLARLLNVELALSGFFQSPTVSGLASAIAASRRSSMSLNL